MAPQTLARLIVVVCLSLLPAFAWAQVADSASIAGVVRDASGAVLPGVTVEAASPALIDKVRTAVTDGQGLF
ncbi:MAG: carboxypeptidase-like regulatory domain-containing protein, partial [Vicinamibacterales bacterium]